MAILCICVAVIGMCSLICTPVGGGVDGAVFAAVGVIRLEIPDVDGGGAAIHVHDDDAFVVPLHLPVHSR